MMTLTLRIDNHATLETGGPVSLVLSGEGAQVGRKAGNDWVLPDPSRHISGHHFDISFERGNYVLTDVSSNGTFLHGERYRIDGSHVIADGERFTVGHYIITAELREASPVAAPPSPIEQRSPAHYPYAPPPTPVAAAQVDEFDDVWGDIASPASAQPSPLQNAPSMSPTEQYQHPGVQMPYGSVPQVARAPQPTSPPVFGSSGLSGAAGQISAPPAFGTPNMQPPMPPMPAPPVSETAPSAYMAQPAPPMPFADPQPPQAPQWSGNDDAFMRGFREGAGIDDPSAVQIPPELLGRLLGQTVRIATDEVMQMLKDRAAVKLFVSNEDRTMRVATGNNPMKFMMDPGQAFEALFLAPRDGYLTGADGFDNALSDIRRHQGAVIAALQPALAELLEGLSPSEIEKDIAGGMLGGGARKSWEEFEKRWERRALEGENGMLDAFIKSFSRHYANAIQKL